MLDAHKDKLSCTICDKTFHSVKATQSHISYHHGRRGQSGKYLQFKNPPLSNMSNKKLSVGECLDTHRPNDGELAPISRCDDVADDRTKQTGEESGTKRYAKLDFRRNMCYRRI